MHGKGGGGREFDGACEQNGGKFVSCVLLVYVYLILFSLLSLMFFSGMELKYIGMCMFVLLSHTLKSAVFMCWLFYECIHELAFFRTP
jgi:hypothetical protein